MFTSVDVPKGIIFSVIMPKDVVFSVDMPKTHPSKWEGFQSLNYDAHFTVANWSKASETA